MHTARILRALNFSESTRYFTHMVDLRCVCVSAFALLKTFPDFRETITWSIIFSAEGRQWDLMLHSLFAMICYCWQLCMWDL